MPPLPHSTAHVISCGRTNPNHLTAGGGKAVTVPADQTRRAPVGLTQRRSPGPGREVNTRRTCAESVAVSHRAPSRAGPIQSIPTGAPRKYDNNDDRETDHRRHRRRRRRHQRRRHGTQSPVSAPSDEQRRERGGGERLPTAGAGRWRQDAQGTGESDGRTPKWVGKVTEEQALAQSGGEVSDR